MSLVYRGGSTDHSSIIADFIRDSPPKHHAALRAVLAGNYEDLFQAIDSVKARHEAELAGLSAEKAQAIKALDFHWTWPENVHDLWEECHI